MENYDMQSGTLLSGSFGKRIRFRRNTHLIVFIHIQKTAGTSLNMAMKEETDQDTYNWHNQRSLATAIENSSINKLQIVSGHFPYGIDKFINRECIYCTLVRDPIDRIESWYYYQLRAKNDVGNELASRLGINDWIDHLITHNANIVRNFQAAKITGYSGYFPNTEAVAEKVIEHMEAKYFFVSTHDRVSDLVNLMSCAIDVWVEERPKGKVASNKPAESEISEDNRKQLMELNVVDRKIYEYASRISAGQVSRNVLTKNRLTRMAPGSKLEIPLESVHESLDLEGAESLKGSKSLLEQLVQAYGNAYSFDANNGMLVISRV